MTKELLADDACHKQMDRTREAFQGRFFYSRGIVILVPVFGHESAYLCGRIVSIQETGGSGSWQSVPSSSTSGCLFLVLRACESR